MLLSVIIPTCHRNDLLARCLDRLAPGMQAGMEPGPDTYEVLVTDDGSRTTARAMIEARYPWARWLPGPQRGPAANRNHGAAHACGEWLAFVDDDCLPDARWLQSLRERVAGERLDIVEGRTECPGKRDTPFEEHVENLTGGVYWSCNLAVRREVFAAMRGFDELFLEAGGEDMEFAWRIQAQALIACFEPAFLVTHPPRRMTCRALFRRVFMIRWMLLYALRTGQAPALDARFPSIAAHLVADRVMELLRTTSHLVTRHDPAHWRRPLFFIALKWLTFPAVLPYLLIWEFRFRRQLIPHAEPGH